MRTPSLKAPETSRPKRGLAGWLLIGACVLLVVLFVAAVVWRRDIIETTLDPKQPFQTYSPPPAPNFAFRSAWAMLPATPQAPAAGDPPADVFFIHPTTFNGGRNWNGPIDDPRADRLVFRVGQSRPEAGARFHSNLVAAVNQFRDRGWRQADAIFVVLDFPDSPDAHDSCSLSLQCNKVGTATRLSSR